MSLYSDILGGLQPRETKSDILDYYGSSRKAAEALHKSGLVRDKQGEPVSVKSLMRRFQQRGGKSQGESSPVYKTLGESLPPIPPENGFHVSGVIWVRYSEDCEERYPDYDLSASEAALLVKMTWAGMGDQAASNGYNDKDLDDPASYALCQEPQLTFTPR